jgi:hypothetical protein
VVPPQKANLSDNEIDYSAEIATMVEPLSDNLEYFALTGCSDDYYGLYEVPKEFFLHAGPQWTYYSEQPISAELRQSVERHAARVYETFFRNGWIEVVFYDFGERNDVVRELLGEDAIAAIRDPRNYDWQEVPLVRVSIRTTDSGDLAAQCFYIEHKDEIDSIYKIRSEELRRLATAKKQREDGNWA